MSTPIFDPTMPADNVLIVSGETAPAQPIANSFDIIFTRLTNVTPLGLTISNSPTQARVQASEDQLDELTNALSARAGRDGSALPPRSTPGRGEVVLRAGVSPQSPRLAQPEIIGRVIHAREVPGGSPAQRPVRAGAPKAVSYRFTRGMGRGLALGCKGSRYTARRVRGLGLSPRFRGRLSVPPSGQRRSYETPLRGYCRVR